MSVDCTSTQWESENSSMEEFTKCPNCHKPTPSENLNCIYCGEVLNRPVGILSGLRYSWHGWIAALIALAVIVGFLLLIL